MSEYIPLFLIILALLAALLRADFVLTVIYLLIGVYTLGRWWSQRALGSVSIERSFSRRIFLGERVPVSLVLHNRGWLPVVWLQLFESIPPELTLQEFFRRVVSLGAHETLSLEYTLEGRKRGYYSLGPLLVHSGDLFGIGKNQERSLPRDHLTVYPKIVPLTRVKLPSYSPLGTLRHHLPIFEDPSRVIGKRGYVAGDSLRRVDWKASAITGQLQVKLFEPSIALETMILLNLNSDEYDFRLRLSASELGIVVAASLANWIASQRQAVGLATNGEDPLLEGGSPLPVPPRRGRSHLMRILDVLARVQLSHRERMVDLLQREIVRLSWGTTLVIISPRLDEALFEGLFSASRAGLNSLLVPCGPLAHVEQVRRRAEYFGYPFYQILDERDLDMWRK